MVTGRESYDRYFFDGADDEHDDDSDDAEHDVRMIRLSTRIAVHINSIMNSIIGITSRGRVTREKVWNGGWASSDRGGHNCRLVMNGVEKIKTHALKVQLLAGLISLCAIRTLCCSLNSRRCLGTTRGRGDGIGISGTAPRGPCLVAYRPPCSRDFLRPNP